MAWRRRIHPVSPRTKVTRIGSLFSIRISVQYALRWIGTSVSRLRRRHVTFGWLLLFVPTIVLFYWKILLTGQFSLLTEGEGVNQAYSWLQFWIISLVYGTVHYPYGTLTVSRAIVSAAKCRPPRFTRCTCSWHYSR